MQKSWKHPHNLAVFLDRMKSVMSEHQAALQSASLVTDPIEKRAAFIEASVKLSTAMGGDWVEQMVRHGRAVINALPD